VTAAMFRRHAGTPELQQPALAPQQADQVELRRAVEPAGRMGGILPQEPAGADHTALILTGGGMIDHDQMVAMRIEPVDVQPQ